jgi:hypothetical protein
MIQFFSRLAGAARFRERGFNGLEEPDVIANLDCFFCSSAERECSG